MARVKVESLPRNLNQVPGDAPELYRRGRGPFPPVKSSDKGSSLARQASQGRVPGRLRRGTGK